MGLILRKGEELVLLGALEALVADPIHARAALSLAEGQQEPRAFKAHHDQEELIPI